MDRVAAQHLVGRLREVRTDRGATSAEAKVAQTKAASLVAKYGLTEPGSFAQGGAVTAKPFTSPPPGWTGQGRGDMPDWSFDVKTGKASHNVKVHHHNDRGNWKIEIFFD